MFFLVGFFKWALKKPGGFFWVISFTTTLPRSSCLFQKVWLPLVSLFFLFHLAVEISQFICFCLQEHTDRKCENCQLQQNDTFFGLSRADHLTIYICYFCFAVEYNEEPCHSSALTWSWEGATWFIAFCLRKVQGRIRSQFQKLHVLYRIFFKSTSLKMWTSWKQTSMFINKSIRSYPYFCCPTKNA